MLATPEQSHRDVAPPRCGYLRVLSIARCFILQEDVRVFSSYQNLESFGVIGLSEGPRPAYSYTELFEAIRQSEEGQLSVGCRGHFRYLASSESRDFGPLSPADFISSSHFVSVKLLISQSILGEGEPLLGSLLLPLSPFFALISTSNLVPKDAHARPTNFLLSQVAWNSKILPIYSDRGPCSAAGLRSRGLHLSRALQCNLSYLIVSVEFAFTELVEGLDLHSDQLTYFKARVSLDWK